MADEGDAGAAQTTSGPGASGEGSVRGAEQLNFEEFAKSARKLNRKSIHSAIGSGAVGTMYRYIVDDEAFYNQMQKTVGMPKMLADTLNTARYLFEPQMKVLLEKIILERVNGLDKDAWPIKYTAHVLGAINRMPTPKISVVQSTQIIVEMEPLDKLLGTYEEFEKAFHHGALKATAKIWNGVTKADRVDILQGPASTSDLFVKEAGRRWRYWSNLRRGAPSLLIYRSSANVYGDDDRFEHKMYDEDGNARAVKVKIKIEGDWNETIDARIKVWGERAPEWGLLEHGQVRYPPIIPKGNPPQFISFTWSHDLRALWTELVLETWNNAIDKFNREALAYYDDNPDPQPYLQYGFKKETYIRKNGATQIVYRNKSGQFDLYSNAHFYD